MEGTRNERSVLITISYIIGFITAFILFATDTNKNTDTYEVAADTQPAAAVASQTEAIELKNDGNIDYTSKPFALLSLDERNIFYCEPNNESQGCSAYIYSKDTGTVQKVYFDDQELIIDKDLVKEIKWTENGLVIGDIISMNPIEPWYLVSQNTPIDLQE